MTISPPASRQGHMRTRTGHATSLQTLSRTVKPAPRPKAGVECTRAGMPPPSKCGVLVAGLAPPRRRRAQAWPLLLGLATLGAMHAPRRMRPVGRRGYPVLVASLHATVPTGIKLLSRSICAPPLRLVLLLPAQLELLLLPHGITFFGFAAEVQKHHHIAFWAAATR
ncbi:hypothetical protein B0H15DRAFT_957617 [Mycena belliarum]|uniref:Uncharacterized protein n=1 Tax=Mycena belliarum TaxID=1033014 RepID=A0AAD6TQR2_9AGAR|nr:hypothetical protein B0H15DRAFT_957617 [Mycena belliae]